MGRDAAEGDAELDHPRAGAHEPLVRGLRREQRVGTVAEREERRGPVAGDLLLHDCRAAEALLPHLPPDALVMADRAYDTDAVRERIQAQGAVPNIPPRRNRRWRHCFSPVLYRGRNAVERMFGRLKDFRRIATRYDKLAANFLAAVQLAATVSCWL